MHEEMWPDRYYDQNGKETNEDQAMSKVVSAPHNFKFYIKKTKHSWFGLGKPYTVWMFHHECSTFGSWMWPSGMPLRFDSEGNILDMVKCATDHANMIGSSWRPGIDS